MEAAESLITSVNARLGRIQYQTIVTGGNHTIIADEPVDVGGMDTGMAPYNLLLASLASCTAITLRMYINRKMWVVDEICIKLDLSKTEKGVHINSALSFKGELDDDQRNRLITIADACPIHKLLVGDVEIFTELQ